tara:strand:- start:9232 stop:10104 length:873 start_codon:yes stop_codon:yes gene_type:complete
MKNNTVVVLINYYSSDLIIEAVNIFSEMPFDIFIIDNSCNYNEQILLGNIAEKIKNVRIIINSDNLGFGGALSKFTETHDNYNSYTFVNPDITGIKTEMFEKRLEIFLNSNNCFFQPVIIDNLRKEKSIQGLKNAKPINIFFEYTLFKYFFKRRVLKAENITNGIQELFVPSGAFFTIKKSSLLLIGGFPKKTFLYFEEWLIASRISKQRNSSIGYVDSNIIVKHAVGGSTKLKFGISTKKMSLIRLKSFLKVVDENFKHTFLVKSLIYIDFFMRSIVSQILKIYVKFKR